MATFEDIIGNFMKGDFSDLLPVFFLIISIAIYGIFIWHFYRFIAKRDCFKMSTGGHPKVMGFLKYFFLFPFVAFLFFIGFSLIIDFLTNYETTAVLTTSFALVAAIRVTAYYSEDLSRDLAKMLPFALLGIFLVDPDYLSVSPSTLKESVLNIPDLLKNGIQFIIFIILVEWVLRIALNIRYLILPKKEEISPEEI